MEKYDVKYSLTEKRVLENTPGLVKYDFQADGDHGCVLSIGSAGGQQDIAFRFALEDAKGALYTDYGAASMREYYENEAAAQEIHKHLFVYIGNNRIDLYENLYPSELRIKDTYVKGTGEDRTVEFEVEVVFNRNQGGGDWKKTFLFRVAMYGEERIAFQYDRVYEY